MSLPILQPSKKTKPQIRGDVIIDESAMIADGVILNASEGTQIIIRAGACLGMGMIITSYEGNVEIQENTILGSGTLIVGSCVIGRQASLGASVTVYNQNIESRSVIPAGTVIGDNSRTVELKNIEDVKIPKNHQDKIDNSNEASQFENPYSRFKINSPSINKNNESSPDLNSQKPIVNQTENQVKATEKEKQKTQTKNINKSEYFTYYDNPESSDQQSNNLDKNVPEEASIKEEVTEIVNNDPWQNEDPANKTVVGKVYINKLLFTLFPDKK